MFYCFRKKKVFLKNGQKGQNRPVLIKICFLFSKFPFVLDYHSLKKKNQRNRKVWKLLIECSIVSEKKEKKYKNGQNGSNRPKFSKIIFSFSKCAHLCWITTVWRKNSKKQKSYGLILSRQWHRWSPLWHDYWIQTLIDSTCLLRLFLVLLYNHNNNMDT